MLKELELVEKMFPPNDDASRRIVIRSAFATIEILLADISANLVKKIPLIVAGFSHKDQHRHFMELCALSHISYDIKQNGELMIRNPRFPFENRVMFVLEHLNKITGSQITPRKMDGWEEFKSAIKIRNRITHPKTKDDLVVPKEDYDIVTKAAQWFVRCHHRVCGGEEY